VFLEWLRPGWLNFGCYGLHPGLGRSCRASCFGMLELLVASFDTNKTPASKQDGDPAKLSEVRAGRNVEIDMEKCRLLIVLALVG